MLTQWVDCSYSLEPFPYISAYPGFTPTTSYAEFIHLDNAPRLEMCHFFNQSGFVDDLPSVSDVRRLLNDFTSPTLLSSNALYEEMADPQSVFSKAPFQAYVSHLITLAYLNTTFVEQDPTVWVTGGEFVSDFLSRMSSYTNQMKNGSPNLSSKIPPFLPSKEQRHVEVGVDGPINGELQTMDGLTYPTVNTTVFVSYDNVEQPGQPVTTVQPEPMYPKEYPF